MLKKKTRQKYLKELGFYNGKIDGKWNKKSRDATLALQKKYFRRKKDRDGEYGKDTDKLLRCAYNMRDIKYFDLDEVECKCGHCTGYPAVISRQLMLNMDDLRKKNGAIKITSGMRCKWKNSRLRGSSKNSYHLKGRAIDFYNKKRTSTPGRRRAMVQKWYEYKKAHYAYANTPGMGNAVHVDVRS